MARQWDAFWIGPAEYHPSQDPGVFAFTKRFPLPGSSGPLNVRVSADQRYKLYCNGQFVGFGPQRGDEEHWFYETYDLRPFLVAGENELVALVWNFGFLAPMAQHTVRTGFVLEGPVPEISTGADWLVSRLDHWQYAMMHSNIGEFYIDVGPGEIVDLRASSSEGATPHVICPAEDRGTLSGSTPWMLIPRSLPPMRYEVRGSEPLVRTGFAGEVSASILFDFGELLCAYPRLAVSCPAELEVTLTYAESLWNPDGSKGDRNAVEGKEMRGYQDKVLVGPGESEFEPLWWRTFRYVLVSWVALPEAGGTPTPHPALSPRGEDLSLPESDVNIFSPWGDGRVRGRVPPSSEPTFTLQTIETGYPLTVESSFEADDESVKPIWDVSIRTAERCAGETYFDCPYYEQLQYVGDTRIQALIGYYLSPDRALQRNAVETLGWSIMENGLTQSRYPSRQTQVIPPFSLWWVLMIFDSMLYDPMWCQHGHGAMLIEWADKAATTLRGYSSVRASEREYWPFADWVPSWPWGVPPNGLDSPIHALTAEMAQVACALFTPLAKAASTLLPGRELAFKDRLKIDPKLAEAMRIPTRISNPITNPPLPWSLEAAFSRPAEGQRPESEHEQALLSCRDLLLGLTPKPWPERDFEARTTYYFSYYKHLAKRPIDYIQELQPWKEMIEDGLTTFAENPEPTRSDCHAWSAHPILGFFQIVAGVTSSAPGWSRARIEPNPGSLRRFDARIAHPKWWLRVHFEGGRFQIETPVPAQFVWEGKEQTLEAGRHEIG